MSVLIVSCTQHTESDFFAQTALGMSFKKMNYNNSIPGFPEVKLKLFTENKLGLSQCYNEAVIEYSGDADIKWIIFVHDDVFICDAFFIEKLNDASTKFDILGLAGARKITFKSEVIAWHIGNNPTQDWSGAVSHPVDENRIYTHAYGPFGEPVLTLDGLFLACKPEVFDNPNVKFDTQFPFDFYDMDFCLTAYKNKVRLGTIDIFVEHASLGNNLGKPQYLAIQKLFLAKWQDEKI